MIILDFSKAFDTVLHTQNEALCRRRQYQRLALRLLNKQEDESSC